jgi:hypothetical protein
MHGVQRIDCGVSLVADRKSIEVSHDPPESGIPPVLNPSHQRPDLLEVLPCLMEARAAEMPRIAGVDEDAIEQFSRRQPIDQRTPSRSGSPRRGESTLVDLDEALSGNRYLSRM